MSDLRILFDSISINHYVREKMAELSSGTYLSLKAEAMKFYHEQGFTQRFAPEGWKICICTLPRTSESAIVWTRDASEEIIRANVRKHLGVAVPAEERPKDETGTPVGYAINIL